MGCGEAPISFVYFDKKPDMKLISYVDILRDTSADSFAEEVWEEDYDRLIPSLQSHLL
jgi:hypothetical protein